MQKRSLILAIIVLYSCRNASSPDAGMQAPAAKKIPKEFVEHGVTRIDDYYWLSNPGDSNVIHHLEAENAYTAAAMKHTEALQKKLYDELVGRMDQKFESLPVKENGYWYYRRYDEGKQYPYYCRKKESTSAPEEIYMDVNELAKGYQIYLVRGRAISRDNNWLAYAIDTNGSRKCLSRFKNLSNNQLSGESIPNTSGAFAWANDQKTVYYTINDHTVRSYKVMRHTLGTNPSTDREIYAEKDSTYDVYLGSSKDNKYIFIYTSSTTTTEARYLDANNPQAVPVIIQPRQRDLIYYPSYYEGNDFYIFTNKNAKNFKLAKTPVSKPGLENWTDVIAGNDSALLENTEILKDYIVAQQKIRGLTQIKVINRKDNSSYYVDFGEDAYVADMSMATDAYDSDSIRYEYTSLTTPGTQYLYNLNSRQKQMLKQQKVGGGYDPSAYETKRLWAKATDGTPIPVSIVYKKSGFKKDGTNPMLIYSYGSYGSNSDPYFNGSVISLLDRGFVYAIPHIRGGQEMGRYWYEDGKLLKKKNTFSDFVDCAQFLVNEKYTAADKLFANGGSAGGMLMGAITNLRPDLFKGVIAEVPWMDVITDMYNADLPLTSTEYDEWGDPHKKECFDYMLSWSPYDNIKDASYPAILATGGLNDTQVPYYSPAKWVQKIREHNKGKQLVLFKCNMGAGHGGESGRFERQKLTALKYAFMLDQLGRNE